MYCLVVYTFLYITKGSSILDSTFNVMFGGRPSVKAYLSVIRSLPPGVHSPTLVIIQPSYQLVKSFVSCNNCKHKDFPHLEQFCRFKLQQVKLEINSFPLFKSRIYVYYVFAISVEINLLDWSSETIKLHTRNIVEQCGAFFPR